MQDVYRGIWVISYRELLRFSRQRSRVLGSFGMPLLLLVVFGAGFNRTIGNLTPGVDFLQFVYPGIITMTVLMSSLFAGLSIVWDREFGFLREVLVAPLSRTGVILGKAVGGGGVALAQGIVLLLLAPVVGIALGPMVILQVIPLLVLVSLTLSGLGILVATMMRSQQGFQVVMQLMIFPLMFLSGIFFPVNNVPAWLQVVSKVNPLTYGVDAIRQVMLGASAAASPLVDGAPLGVTVFGHTMSVLEDAVVLGVLAVALMTAAVWSFNRQE